MESGAHPAGAGQMASGASQTGAGHMADYHVTPPLLRVVMQLSPPPPHTGQPMTKLLCTCFSFTHADRDRFLLPKAVVEASDLQRCLQQAAQQRNSTTHQHTKGSPEIHIRRNHGLTGLLKCMLPVHRN